jgi:hypothetical protein
MSTHTPLPWAMVLTSTDGHHLIFAESGPIADVKVRLDADEQLANALVLLHAPELLAALKALRDPAYGNPTSPADTARIDAMADAAIAKAEGR